MPRMNARWHFMAFAKQSLHLPSLVIALCFPLLGALIVFLNSSINLAPGVKTYTSKEHVNARRAAGNSSPWSYMGCFSDNINDRTLYGSSFTSGSLTVESCISYCTTAGFNYSGVEFAQECYCGTTVGVSAIQELETDCSDACAGNATEICGGSSRINLYNSTTPPTAMYVNPGVGNWTSLGCFNDSSTRTLVHQVATPGGGGSMTVELCLAACAGYKYAGIEYASECYCDNSFENGGGPDVHGPDYCNMPCNGNSSEICGGPDRLNVYLYNVTSSVSSSSSLSTTSSTSSGSSSSSVATSSSISTTSSITTTSSSSTSSTTSSSTISSQSVSVTTTSTSTKSSTAGTVTSTSSTSSTTGPPVSTTLPLGWVYAGCWVDQEYGRVIQWEQPDNSALTIESCVNTCAGLNYTVAGMEYSVQCFCGDSIYNAGALAANQADCNMPCAGNSAEFCGAGNRLSVYNTGSLITYGLPTAQTSYESWTYLGCRTDEIGNRTLPWQIILPANNSAAVCLGMCKEYGYMAGAMEWNEECYCGDHVDMLASPSAPALESDCNAICTGNVSEICGGTQRISYYEWTGTPLYTWLYPEGTGMGVYEQILNAPIVALITTPGVNGKVQFIEKYGTSETSGSTGAYELDLFYGNNATAAWRTMHVATDVFCSASLTLPDKAGRQLNVGGWNYDSVWGLRVYWPDGSPGEPSYNDWEENYNEIHLLAARWYPTAMTMTNGSILVIGGELAAAGPPSPTLELLPFTGGGLVFFEWLNRTDPLNLYPFLCVLPSGGIFVQYYNEARILDPVSFDTIKVLPNVPGAVNNIMAGRTYPLIGTMMLLPQYAPYSDPLTILICGGSSPGGSGAMATDNCVTTQPDATEPVWTIERMPFRRVMTSMTSLPDGTYMILNGAQMGEAGFALGTMPNFQAVLYNPSLPLHSRMSLMASTTIARLYHNEASLLQDGSILISGSDPEDLRFPEEYRLEIFYPPYLLSGLTKPSFTITNKDWTYGETITISIILPTGNYAGAKVSLIGAASTTHGNSMGQRTIFPACTCTATQCTITAPPNVNVSPPGWFQLYLLDGPTPSNSTYVRIGGDPGELGNWPNLPGFTLPGV